MLKRNSFVILIALVFLFLSFTGYFIHYLIFRDLHHIFLYLIGDLAFLPLEVLLVVVIIERILNRREQTAKMKKLNMVIGAFFSEVGNDLLSSLLPYFRNKEEISRNLNLNASWTKKDFQKASEFAYHLPVEVEPGIDIVRLKQFLSAKRDFLLTLLENPGLLENDRFTDLLWAVTHLSEELAARQFPETITGTDLEHIKGDIRRMYDHLASEWLDYTEHLKSNYPYLFSLVLRTHPFQEHPSPSVK